MMFFQNQQSVVLYIFHQSYHRSEQDYHTNYSILLFCSFANIFSWELHKGIYFISSATATVCTTHVKA
jgi:hypothetical protein